MGGWEENNLKEISHVCNYYNNCETQRFPDQKLSSSIFTCRLFVCSSVRPASVTSPLISTLWCFRPYKPYIFWKLMTPTIHWPTDHSPITHTDPSDPPNPPRTQPIWPFLHFMTFCSIQTIYFLKPHGIHYPLPHCIDHFHTDQSDPPIHGIAWPSESRTVVQSLVLAVFTGWAL